MSNPAPSNNSNKKTFDDWLQQSKKNRPTERQYSTCCACQEPSVAFDAFLRPDNDDSCSGCGHIFCAECDWKKVIEPPGTRPVKYNWTCCECATAGNPYVRSHIPSDASCEECGHNYCSGCTQHLVSKGESDKGGLREEEKSLMMRGKGKRVTFEK